MTNMRGVGGAPRGLRTQQQSLHGRRPHEIRRTTAPARRASSQRSTARRDSANATIIPPTNERQSTTNKKSSHPHHPSTIKSKPTNLKGDDQGITPSPKKHRIMEVFRATGKRHGRITTKMRGGQRVPTARFQRVEIIGRTGERAEIRVFLEVIT